jgi:tetratricopeptide (TPR) repeat protein
VYGIKKIFLVIGLVTVAAAQAPQSPLSDTRLTVHTLLREDIFAGFLSDDLERFARAEKNIELLLVQRPTQRGNLLVWKGGAALYRAVRAHEANRADEFQRYYRQALDNFDEARKTTTGNDGVAAITGGSFAIFADRLPKEYRAAAWSTAYENYQALYKQQAPFVDKLPVHLRGEMLSGLAQSAQRTGRKEEAAQYIDKILAVLADTPYEPMARKWKSNPETAATTSLTCMNCHDAGRLAARVASLNGN